MNDSDDDIDSGFVEKINDDLYFASINSINMKNEDVKVPKENEMTLFNNTNDDNMNTYLVDMSELSDNDQLLSKVTFMRKILGASPPQFSWDDIFDESGSLRWNQFCCSYSSVWYIIIHIMIL